jgi:hypothetical protein
MENIIDFPVSADRPISTEPIEADTDIEALHAEASRDLEGRLGDCLHMARIATQMTSEAPDIPDRVLFAVCHVQEMLEKLKRDYYAAWYNEKPGGLHTSSI